MVKNLSTVQEIWAQCLEKGMAAHSSILAWRNPWREEPGQPQRIRASNTFNFSLDRLLSLFQNLELLSGRGRVNLCHGKPIGKKVQLAANNLA